MVKFNLIGFNFPDKRYKWQGDDWVMPKETFRTCVIHNGSRLVHMEGDEKGILRCHECGTIGYQEKDTIIDEQIKSKFGPTSNKTKIIQRRKKKRYFDSFGTEITDPTLLNEVKTGKITVIKYNEQKIEGDPKKPKHVIKSK